MKRTERLRLLARLCGAAAVLVLADGRHFAAGQEEDLLQTRGRLLTEERRQGNVRRNLSGVVRRIDLLMLDLASNDLFLEGGGEHVVNLNRTLAALNTNNVPSAEGHIRLARQDATNVLSHIENADREVSVIVRDLDIMLKEMGLTLIEDLLLAQLRSIIKTEELLRRETTEWGRQLLLTPEHTGQAQTKLFQAQDAVLKQLDIFLQMLLEAGGKEADAARRRKFAAAAAVFRSGRPETALQQAAAEIEAGRPIGGVEQQDKALKALRAVEEALTGQITDDMATVRDVMEHLKQILKDQQQLQQEVKQANAQQFQERHLKMQARQTDIGKDLQECYAQASKTPAAFAVRKAQEAMKEAQAALGRNLQDSAIVQQEEAIVCLMTAIEALNAMSVLPPTLLAEAPKYPWLIQILATNVVGDDVEELLDLDKTSSKKIRDFGDVVEGAPGKDPSSSMPSAPSPSSMTPPSDSAPETGSEGPPDLRGEAVALGPEQINALERRNRAAVFQKYVNRLPKEFRQQVSDYYELLAE
jgi:RecA/RadA recombinase